MNELTPTLEDVIDHFNKKCSERIIFVTLTVVEGTKNENPRNMTFDCVSVNSERGEIKVQLLTESHGQRAMIFQWFPLDSSFKEVFPMTRVGELYVDALGNVSYKIIDIDGFVEQFLQQLKLTC